jgi:serine/threonine protein kinase
MATIDSASASSASAASANESSSHQLYFMDSTKGNIKEVYSFQQKLANGGFGIVYLAEHRESHQKFAIKAI